MCGERGLLNTDGSSFTGGEREGEGGQQSTNGWCDMGGVTPGLTRPWPDCTSLLCCRHLDGKIAKFAVPDDIVFVQEIPHVRAVDDHWGSPGGMRCMCTVFVSQPCMS